MMNTNSQGYRGTGSFGSGEPLRKKTFALLASYETAVNNGKLIKYCFAFFQSTSLYTVSLKNVPPLTC